MRAKVLSLALLGAIIALPVPASQYLAGTFSAPAPRADVAAAGPLQTLIDYLEAGDPLGEFLEDFPTVSREQAIAALHQAKDALIARAHPS